MRNEIVRHIAWEAGVRMSQARDDHLAHFTSPLRGSESGPLELSFGITALIERLFDDAVGQVRYLVAFANLRLFEADVLAAETVEETDPFA